LTKVLHITIDRGFAEAFGWWFVNYFSREDDTTVADVIMQFPNFFRPCSSENVEKQLTKRFVP